MRDTRARRSRASAAPHRRNCPVAKVTMPSSARAWPKGHRPLAQAAGRHRREVRAAARGDHRQGQRRGSIALRRCAQGDPRPGGRHGPEQRRDRGDRDGRGRGSGGHRPRRPLQPDPPPARALRGRPRPRRVRRAPRRGDTVADRGTGAHLSSPQPAPAQPAVASAAPSVAAAADRPAGDPNARMTPAVRRLLREHDLEPAQSRAPVAAAGSPART